MDKNSKYAIIGIIAVIIVVAGGFFLLKMAAESVEEKFIELSNNNSLNNDGNLTVYEYNGTKVIYIDSKKNVDDFLLNISSNENATAIDLDNTPNGSLAYKLSNGKFALVIVSPEDKEAVYIESNDQDSLSEVAGRYNFL